MSKRVPRFNQLLKKEIGKIFLKEVDLPEAFITITRVETSSNLYDASVYISVMPISQANEVFRALNRDIYFIQQILNKRLRTRPIPKIKFLKEAMTEKAEKIEEILENIKKKTDNKD